MPSRPPGYLRNYSASSSNRYRPSYHHPREDDHNRGDTYKGDVNGRDRYKYNQRGRADTYVPSSMRGSGERKVHVSLSSSSSRNDEGMKDTDHYEGSGTPSLKEHWNTTSNNINNSPNNQRNSINGKALDFKDNWELFKKEYLKNTKDHIDPAGDDQSHVIDPFTLKPIKSDSFELSTKKANYKVTYDPELGKNPAKGNHLLYRFKGEGMLEPLDDPRLKIKNSYAKYCVAKKSKHPQYKALIVPVFQYDKNSVGDPPSCEIVVWNFSSKIGPGIIKSNFSKFGPILNIEMICDPISAIPLGVCLIKFNDNDGKSLAEAHKSAILAVNEAGNKLIIDNSRVKVGLQTKKNGLLKEKQNNAIRHFQERKKLQQQKHEHEKKRQLEKQKILEERKRAQRAKEEEEKRRHDMKLKAKQMATYKDATSKSLSFLGSSGSNILKSNVDSEINNKKVIMPEELQGQINSRPFLFLSDVFYPTRFYQTRDLKSKLSRYEWTKILLAPKVGFFVVFSNKNSAIKCYNEQNNRVFHKIRAVFHLCLDSSSYEIKHAVNDDPVEEAAYQIMKDLENMLRKDIKERTVGPSVMQYLNSEQFQEIKVKEEAKHTAAAPTSENYVSSKSNDIFGIGNSALPQLKLPSFRKKDGAKPGLKSKDSSMKKLYKRSNRFIPLNRMMDVDNDDEDDEEDEDEDDNDNEDNDEDGNINSDDASEDNGDDYDDKLEEKATEVKNKSPKKSVKKFKVNRQKNLAFYSSSEDEEDEDQKGELSHNKAVKAHVKEMTSPAMLTPENELDVKIDIEKEVTEIDVTEKPKKELDDVGDVGDVSEYDAVYGPSTELGRTVYPALLIHKSVDLEGFKSLVRDEEDLELMKEVFKDVKPSESIQNIEYWCWRNKKIDEQRLKDRVEIDEDVEKELENKTGSFRSEGYRKILDSLKAEYLPHRRKVHRNEPLNTLKNNEFTENNNSKNNTVKSSRVNRAKSRRLVADTKQILGSETDILKLNSLNKRKKPVNFARSAIHNWGLYALEPIAANEMIIEYVGDSLRQQIAELREKQYLKSGIGSSYLFRIDDQTVIDATKKGGIARFINHCCTPSCTAKIIKVDGKKRIVIYALKDIQANEELTYDYKFERETNDDERIACLCGAPGCKGFLN